MFESLNSLHVSGVLSRREFLNLPRFSDYRFRIESGAGLIIGDTADKLEAMEWQQENRSPPLRKIVVSIKSE